MKLQEVVVLQVAWLEWVAWLMWVAEDLFFHSGSKLRVGGKRPWAGDIFIPNVFQWIVGDNIFCGPLYVCREVTDVCDQVLHIGETGEQLLVKYQGVGKQLISYWVPSSLLKWFLWEVSLRH